jgi:hypothetical protein
MLTAYSLSLPNIDNKRVVPASSIEDLGNLITGKTSVVVLHPDNPGFVVVGDIQLSVWSRDHTLMQRIVTPPSRLEAKKKPYPFQQVPMPEDFDYAIVVDEDGIRHGLPVNELASKLFAGVYCIGKELRGTVALFHKAYIYRTGGTDYEYDTDDGSDSEPTQETAELPEPDNMVVPYSRKRHTEIESASESKQEPPSPIKKHKPTPTLFNKNEDTNRIVMVLDFDCVFSQHHHWKTLEGKNDVDSNSDDRSFHPHYLLAERVLGKDILNSVSFKDGKIMGPESSTNAYLNFLFGGQDRLRLVKEFLKSLLAIDIKIYISSRGILSHIKSILEAVGLIDHIAAVDANDDNEAVRLWYDVESGETKKLGFAGKCDTIVYLSKQVGATGDVLYADDDTSEKQELQKEPDRWALQSEVHFFNVGPKEKPYSTTPAANLDSAAMLHILAYVRSLTRRKESVVAEGTVHKPVDIYVDQEDIATFTVEASVNPTSSNLEARFYRNGPKCLVLPVTAGSISNTYSACIAIQVSIFDITAILPARSELGTSMDIPALFKDRTIPGRITIPVTFECPDYP